SCRRDGLGRACRSPLQPADPLRIRYPIAVRPFLPAVSQTQETCQSAADHGAAEGLTDGLSIWPSSVPLTALISSPKAINSTGVWPQASLVRLSNDTLAFAGIGNSRSHRPDVETALCLRIHRCDHLAQSASDLATRTLSW